MAIYATAAHASAVPPSYLLSDTFANYTVGSYLDTATSTPWLNTGDPSGHWNVTSSGCLTNHCVYAFYDTSGMIPGASLYSGYPDGSLGGSVSFSVKWSGVYGSPYSAGVNVGWYNGTTATSQYGVTFQDGTTGGTMKIGGSEYWFDNLVPTTWHNVVLYWVTDPSAGTRISASVDGSLPQEIYSDTNGDADFAQHGMNYLQLFDAGHGANTYIDDVNSQLLDVSAIQTVDYGAIATSTCSITNVTGCFQNALQWAFTPPQGAFNGLLGLKDLVASKPPFGYFTTAKEQIAGLDGTASSTFSIGSVSGITTYIFHPFDVALAAIWWALVGFWFFFNRARHIEI